MNKQQAVDGREVKDGGEERRGQPGVPMLHFPIITVEKIEKKPKRKALKTNQRGNVSQGQIDKRDRKKG